MTDPLSIAAGVVGLLTAAAQVSLILTSVVSKSRSAPRECQRVRSDVDDVRHILLQLQLYVSGNKQATRSNRALIMIDQVAATLASCVLTFDELKMFVESLQTESKMGVLDRVRWVSKKGDLEDYQTRVETHKTSLSLMLQILNSQRQDDAEEKVDRLAEKIELIYKNQLIAFRMAAYDMSQLEPMHHPALLLQPRQVGRNESFNGPRISGEVFTTSYQNQHHLPSSTVNITRDSRGFAFEELLMNSRAYKNAAHNNSDAFSVTSSAGRTATWSMLSGLSLSEMSNIAILAIPVYASDLNDKAAYDFSPPSTDDTASIASDDSPTTLGDNTRTKRSVPRFRKLFARKSDTGLPVSIEEPAMQLVFGAELQTSVLYSHVPISLVDEAGESFIWGHIPIVVAKCCVFLKEKGINVENIFGPQGHALRVAQLQRSFDTKPRYGKGIDWTGYTVHDASTVLLRYLKSLPEPLVPYEFYDTMTAVVRPFMHLTSPAGSAESAEAIKRLQSAIQSLPALNRQLLLYILDVAAVFASMSDYNKMTSARLVSVFQPALISKRPADMDQNEHECAAQTAIFMIEYQDHFLIGMDPVASTTAAEEVASVDPEEMSEPREREGRSAWRLSRSNIVPAARDNSSIESSAEQTSKASSPARSEKKFPIKDITQHPHQAVDRSDDEAPEFTLPLRTLTAASSDDWQLWFRAEQRIAE